MAAVDVQAHDAPELTLDQARDALRTLGESGPTLVLTDVVGATPANVAQQLVNGHDARLVAGVNLPALVYADLTGHARPRATIARAASNARPRSPGVGRCPATPRRP